MPIQAAITLILILSHLSTCTWIHAILTISLSYHSPSLLINFFFLLSFFLQNSFQISIKTPTQHYAIYEHISISHMTYITGYIAVCTRHCTSAILYATCNVSCIVIISLIILNWITNTHGNPQPSRFQICIKVPPLISPSGL